MEVRSGHTKRGAQNTGSGGGCAARGREKLECNLQKFLRSIGAEWLWTPAYCPWLQPIETFWAGGKNQCAPLLLPLALACAVRETLLLLLLLCCVAVLPGRTATVAR